MKISIRRNSNVIEHSFVISCRINDHRRSGLGLCMEIGPRLHQSPVHELVRDLDWDIQGVSRNNFLDDVSSVGWRISRDVVGNAL